MSIWVHGYLFCGLQSNTIIIYFVAQNCSSFGCWSSLRLVSLSFKHVFRLSGIRYSRLILCFLASGLESTTSLRSIGSFFGCCSSFRNLDVFVLEMKGLVLFIFNVKISCIWIYFESWEMLFHKQDNTYDRERKQKIKQIKLLFKISMYYLHN